MANHSQEAGSIAAGKQGQPPARVDLGLGVDQQKALELLLVGRGMAETAAAVGISRTTLYRWLRHDATFGAAYNQWHDQLEVGSQARLLGMTDKAADAIEKALEEGDARTALQLLKGMGLLCSKPVGLTDAEELREQMEAEKEERRGDREQKRLVTRTIEKMMD